MSESVTGYDPQARRDTPLALKLKQRIEEHGPITLHEYMQACLQDPDHGYYRHKPAIGGGADFITAPEISQIFGELIGLWSAVTWQRMGQPSRFNLIEIGPGRGTLMRDALRAVRKLPGFVEALDIVFVDISRSRVEIGSDLLDAGRISKVESVTDLPSDIPSIVLANEFLDTCPVQQFQMARPKPLTRAIGLDDARLTFTTSERVESLFEGDVIASNPHLRDGEIFEAQDWTVLHQLAKKLQAPWSALFIDYGQYEAGSTAQEVVAGDTLQAVRNHTFEHPLTSPGEADLTCQVDFNDVKLQFETISNSGQSAKLAVDGPITQAEFLGRLGVIERASRLMSANPGKAAEIEAGVMRLISPQGMGTRFKAIGVRSSDLPTLPGFE